MENNELLTPKEAAQLMRISRGALGMKIHRGEIPMQVIVRPGKRAMLFRRRQLERWLLGESLEDKEVSNG